MSNIPNNHKSDIGRFMVGVGAVLECTQDGTILLVKRSQKNDYRQGEWEITYGRIAQFETPIEGLHREYGEETGISQFEVKKLMRVWHIFRGEKIADNELIGITFWAQIDHKPPVTISDEHSEYQWATPEEALALVTNDGIKQDIQEFMKEKKEHQC